MPIYHKLGNIPHKRHTQFRKPDGSLYSEQLFGTIGFDGMYSNSYHLYRPTMVKEIEAELNVAPINPTLVILKMYSSLPKFASPRLVT